MGHIYLDGMGTSNFYMMMQGLNIPHPSQLERSCKETQTMPFQGVY